MRQAGISCCFHPEGNAALKTFLIRYETRISGLWHRLCGASLQDVKLLKKAFLELKEEKEESIKNQEDALIETEALRLDLFYQFNLLILWMLNPFKVFLIAAGCFS